MEKKIAPSFVHFGIEDGVNCVFTTNLKWQGELERVVFVGSNSGKCFLYFFRTSKLVSIHEDSDHRQIMSMGIWPFEENSDSEGCSEAGDSDLKLLIWIHFRGSAIEVYQCEGDKDAKLNRQKRIHLAHYGFCKALSDPKKGSFFLPDYENNCNLLRIRYKSCGEKCYSLSEEFLVKSFVRRQALREANSLDSKTIQELQLFKGLLMVVEFGVDTDPSERILMAFEDSTVCLFDLRTKEVIDCLKHPKHHRFLSLTVKKRKDDLLISVSVMGQVYLLKYVFSEETIQSCCVIKRCKSVNCSTMIFSHGNNLGQNWLICGFSNGLVQIFDLKQSNQEVIKIADIEFHEASIQCMMWMNEDSSDEGTNRESESHLVIGSADGKLAVYSSLR